MKRRFRTLILTSAAVLIVGGAIYAPVALFQIQDKGLFTTVHQRQKNENTLDFDIEEIAQLQSLRKIFSPEFHFDDYPISNYKQIVHQELAQLSGKGILASGFVQELPDSQIYIASNRNSSFFSTDVLQSENGYPPDYSWVARLSPMGIYIALDPFTHRVIGMDISSATMDFLQTQEPQELMRQFVEYLGLDVIGDWQYNKLIAVSQKANLRVNCFLQQWDVDNSQAVSLSLNILPLV